MANKPTLKDKKNLKKIFKELQLPRKPVNHRMTRMSILIDPVTLRKFKRAARAGDLRWPELMRGVLRLATESI